jgi:hypothetical protein
MDNIFEILIYGLIIISFLSGIFRKKDKKKRPPVQRPQTQEPADREVTVAQTSPKEDYDILKELEDFFKVGEPEAETGKTQPIPSPVESTESVDFDEHVQSDEWHQPTASEHRYTNIWKEKQKELFDRKSSIDSGVEEQAAKFEKQLKKKKTAASEISKKIRSKLQNPASLKDYIVISEIMAKPKAFRR